MSMLLVTLAGICIICGFLGTIVPFLPGVPLSYIGILLLHISTIAQYSVTFLITWAFIVIAVQLLDNFIPVLGTKKFGDSKAGVWGSTIGLVGGFFFGPWGIILGPFLGAVIGELIVGKQIQVALKAGFGSFIGFLSGTIIKMVVCGFFIYYYIYALIHPIWATAVA